MKNQWYKDSVVYQIYPRSFCDSNGDGIGDIAGIISKIDYLVELGIDAIWFSPLYKSPNSDYGYDISDYCSIHPDYGTLEQFDTMLKLLHDKGIRVIMDLVINHTSDEHEWFSQSRSSKDNPYRNYYFWADGRGKNGKKPPNNWSSFFLGSAWQYDDNTKQWYLHLFDKKQPDLNYQNPKVIQEIKNILKFWLDKGVDGFRCDVITLLDKTDGLPMGKPNVALTGREHYMNGPRMPQILGELQRDVLSKYDAFTVGESVFIDVDTALEYTSEDNQLLTTVFAFDHMSCDNYMGVKQFVKKFSLRQLKQCLTRWQHGLYGKGWNTPHFENHDQARIVGRYCDDTTYRVQGAKMMGTVLMTLSGTPFVYQGQEIGTTSIRMKELDRYQDVESHRSYTTLKKVFGHKKAMKNIAYCSRDNARTPVQWSSEHMAGFTSGDKTWLDINPNYTTVNIADSKQDPNGVWQYYQKLIQLRKANPLYRYGTYCDLMPKHRHILCYARSYQDNSLIVVANFGKTNQKFVCPKLDAEYQLTTSNYTDSPKALGSTTLRPHECMIYTKVK